MVMNLKQCFGLQ